MNFFKTKPNMLQQDFHRGNNPAYDKVAFVAEHYDELVFMYKDILEHLKQGGTGTGGGCTHITKQVESPYGFVQLDKESFKLIGYDLDNPDDIQFLLHNTRVKSYTHFDGADAYPSSKGIEYLSGMGAILYYVDTFFSRNLDDFFDNPEMLQKAGYAHIYYNNSSYIPVNVENIKSKEAFLDALYEGVLSEYNSSYYFEQIQNNPIKLTVDEVNTDGTLLYEKTSDSVENNILYVDTKPRTAIYKNALIFPLPNYNYYGTSTQLYIDYMTPLQMYGHVTVKGTGDIVKCKAYGNGITLSADLPEVEFKHTDTHTFTLTIDSDIKDDH